MVLAIGLVAVPLPSDGQQPAKVYRIGWLSTGRSTGRDDSWLLLGEWQRGAPVTSYVGAIQVGASLDAMTS